MNVSLTPELEKFVEKQVASQRYQTASEVVRHALRQMQDEEEVRTAEVEAIRKGLTAAERQIDQGQFVELRSADEKLQFLENIRRRGRERLAKHHRRSA